ncbi:PHD-finger domain-containing protein [Babesia ovata]|uniref:PHD-finger domain-containing protein n=1 Tax=Babesia ovata TaxID=189622 RepID=A0A2H6K7E4_9APIC|nr:PHD-finger domain-containing protein [Babesia ovata]GBE58913.1 PHD-finger domain-containing protein [Babesia ovata]
MASDGAAQETESRPDLTQVADSSTGALHVLPTDYISALAQYGSISGASEWSRCDKQPGASASTERIFCDSGTFAQSSYEGALYQAFEPSAWLVESEVLNRTHRYCLTGKPVVLPAEERCDACLGLLIGDVCRCSACEVVVHQNCYGPESKSWEWYQGISHELLPLTRGGARSDHLGTSTTLQSPFESPKRRVDLYGTNKPNESEGPTVHFSDLPTEYKEIKCDVCSAEDLKDTPKCTLCGLSGGAMRHSADCNRWVHCSCVAFAPESSGITFRRPLRMREPEGVQAFVAQMTSSNNSCDACGSSDGLVMPCSFAKCCKYVHARCTMFYKGYGGCAFSDQVYYMLDERQQYFDFLGTFCAEHSNYDYVVLGIQMYLRRRQVLREQGSSSYRKYQNEVADIVRMASAVTASALHDDDEDEATEVPPPELVLHVEPHISVPSEDEDLSDCEMDDEESELACDQRSLDDWKDYLLSSDAEKGDTYEIAAIENLEGDEIDLNIPIEAASPCNEVPVVEVQAAAGDAGLDGSGSQFRSQRMMWQKFDIFRPLPYGPASDGLLANMDQNSRKKSVAEYSRLEDTVLACSDFLEPRDLSEMFLQQILFGCRGVMDLLQSLKDDIDQELQSSLKANNGLPPDERRHSRFHVLVDTGRTAGVLIFKVNKWLLEVLQADAALTERTDKSAISAAGIALDEEVRHFLSHVQSEVVRNTYSNTSFYTNSGVLKEIDFSSGVGEYGLRDDIRQLHLTVNAVTSESEMSRIRRKMLKKGKGDPSLNSMELEKYVILNPMESELLRRCAFEMSHANDANIKLAVLKNTVDASVNTSCLQMIDWSAVVSKIKTSTHHTGGSKGGSKGSSRSSHSSKSSRSSHADSGGNSQGATVVTDPMAAGASGRTSVGAAGASTPTSTNDSSVTLPPVPMVYLGKHTWPVVDDTNFVRRQKEITECDLSVVSSQLRKIRENIRENVLEMNSGPPTMNQRLGYATKLLEQYESMERWTTLVTNFCRGICDSQDSMTPTAASSARMHSPTVVTPNTPDMRNAAKKAEGMAEGAYCSVCFVNKGNNLNPIYTCSRCFMSAHRNCYGVSRAGKESDNSDYICRRCEYERRTMGGQWQTAFRSCSILCSICGRGGGALKRCDVDEWAHVFCLLCLMPETECSNYTAMEPWTLAGIARWRRETMCSICGVDWGYVLRCNDCEVAAHPLCAWLHGYHVYATSSVGYPAHDSQNSGLMRELRVRVQCNAHDESRQWQQFVSTRNKRFLNRDTAYWLFEGCDKRRKSRAMFLESIISSESIETGSVAADPTDPVSIPGDRRCGICFGTGLLTECNHCHARVHYNCYVEQDAKGASSLLSDKLNSTKSMTCDVCRNGDDGAVCAICRLATGLLKQVPTARGSGDTHRRYIHAVCGVCFPEVLIQMYKGQHAGIGDTPKRACTAVGEANGASLCACCRSPEGLMVRCFKEGCNVVFHAICGMMNRYVVESHSMDIAAGPRHVAFCQQHSLLSRSVGNNIKLMLRLRPVLKLLSEAVEDLASQDIMMRAWYRKRQELLNAECPLGSLIQKPVNKS